MPMDWQLMMRLREHQQSLAAEKAARHRTALDEGQAQVTAAQTHWADRRAARTALWQDAAAALAQGGCSAEELQQACVWSNALAVQVAQAGQKVHEARLVVVQRERQWQASRDALRSATAKVQKTEWLQQREMRAAARQMEHRMEDTLAEWGQVCRGPGPAEREDDG